MVFSQSWILPIPSSWRNREIYPFSFVRKNQPFLVGFTFVITILIIIFASQMLKLSYKSAPIISQFHEKFLLIFISANLFLVFCFFYFSVFNNIIALYKISPVVVYFLMNFFGLFFTTSTWYGNLNDINQALYGLYFQTLMTFNGILFIFFTSRKYWSGVFRRLLDRPQLFLFFLFILFLYFVLISWQNFLLPKFQNTIKIPNILNRMSIRRLSTFSVLSESSSNQISLEKLWENGNSTLRIIFALQVIFFAPIYEEFLFRFFPAQIFGQRRIFWACIFSVFWFWSAHFNIEKDFFGHNTTERFEVLKNNIISFAGPGLCFFIIFVWTKYSLIYPIIWHASHNAWTMVVVFFTSLTTLF